MSNASHLSELLHTFYKQIIAAVRPKAPLLYAKLERTCRQGVPFEEFHDGSIAWGILVAMSTSHYYRPQGQTSARGELGIVTIFFLLYGKGNPRYGKKSRFTEFSESAVLAVRLHN